MGPIFYDENGNVVTPPPQDVNVHVDKTLTVSDYQSAVRQLDEAVPGAQYIPDQYDRVWTHVKEAIGQMSPNNQLLWRAIYPGDVNNRTEIAISARPDTLADMYKDGKLDPKRWKLVRIEELTEYISKDALIRRDDGNGGVCGGIYGRSENGIIKHYFYDPELGRMDSQTVTHHPATRKRIKPGEVIWCGRLPKGWNKEDIFEKYRAPDKDGKEIEKLRLLYKKGEAPAFGGTRFTNYANADPSYFHLVRDLDLVIDYTEIKREDRGKKEPTKKIMIGVTPEDPKKALLADYNDDPKIGKTAEFSWTEFAERMGKTRKQLEDEGYKLWNQKYKYAFYFTPNAEQMIDPDTGEFRFAEFGEKVAAYDAFSRIVPFRHNFGKGSYSSGRNGDFSPPYLAGKSHFYIRNPHLVDYVAELEKDKIWFDAAKRNKKTQDPLYQKGRRIANFIERIETGGGILEADGTPVEDAVYAIARGDGDLSKCGARARYMTGWMLGSAVGGVVLAGGLAALAMTAVAGLPLLSLATVGVSAMAGLGGTYLGGKLGLEYSSVQIQKQFHPYERGIRTDAYVSALSEKKTPLQKYMDQCWFSFRGLCVKTFVRLENTNAVEMVDFRSKAGLYFAGASGIAASAAALGIVALPVLPALAIAGATLAAGGAGYTASKMAAAGEKQFKHLYYIESTKAMDADKIFTSRARDQYTRINPSSLLGRDQEHQRRADLYKKPLENPVTLFSQKVTSLRATKKAAQQSQAQTVA